MKDHHGLQGLHLAAALRSFPWLSPPPPPLPLPGHLGLAGLPPGQGGLRRLPPLALATGGGGDGGTARAGRDRRAGGRVRAAAGRRRARRQAPARAPAQAPPEAAGRAGAEVRPGGPLEAVPADVPPAGRGMEAGGAGVGGKEAEGGGQSVWEGAQDKSGARVKMQLLKKPNSKQPT